MSRKPDPRIEEMLRTKYMSSSEKMDVNDGVVSLVELSNSDNNESTVIEQAEVKSSEKSSKNNSQVYVTTVRLPQEVKRAVDLYRIDERPRSGMLSVSQVISDALKAYIPEKYFD